MPEEPTPASNGQKAMAGGIALLALIGGMAAIVTPMHQRIGSLADRLVTIESRMEEDNLREGQDRERRGEDHARFTEIETQFRNLDERTQRIEAGAKERVVELDRRLQAEMMVADRHIVEGLTRVRAQVDAISMAVLKRAAVIASVLERLKFLEEQ